MVERDRHCSACGFAISSPTTRWCKACGNAIERRSADRPPASVWRRRRIALIAGAVVSAAVIGGTVAYLTEPDGGAADGDEGSVGGVELVDPAGEPVSVR